MCRGIIRSQRRGGCCENVPSSSTNKEVNLPNCYLNLLKHGNMQTEQSSLKVQWNQTCWLVLLRSGFDMRHYLHQTTCTEQQLRCVIHMYSQFWSDWAWVRHTLFFSRHTCLWTDCTVRTEPKGPERRFFSTSAFVLRSFSVLSFNSLFWSNCF